MYKFMLSQILTLMCCNAATAFFYFHFNLNNFFLNK